MTSQALSGVIALRLVSREGSPSLLEVRHTHTLGILHDTTVRPVVALALLALPMLVRNDVMPIWMSIMVDVPPQLRLH